MQQLTGLDASFLALETANTTGHVGGLSVLDPSGAPKPLTLSRLTEVMAERLPLVPVLRQKLLNVPLGLDQPYWVDDPDSKVDIPRTAAADLRGVWRLLRRRQRAVRRSATENRPLRPCEVTR